MTKRFALAAAASLVATVATAQDQVLHIYNWSDYIAEDTLAQFTARTGIRVVYDVYDSNEVLDARLMAGRSGYDIVVPTSDFLQRQVAIGLFQPLDRSLLPNWDNMDPELMAAAAGYDPDNRHSVIYMWGTTGIGFNVDAVAERLGDDFEVNSWSLIFDPAIISQLADCGVAVLDTPTELLPAAMNFLGLDPTSDRQEDLEAAAALMQAIRPHIRYFHSSQYISDLANGEICVAVGYSGDILQARDRAAEADRGVDVGYVIPEEGAHVWFDLLAIPVDAPNPGAAHAFINFLMEPEIIAEITNYVAYANANRASLPFVDEEILNDPGIFPTAQAQSRLWPSTVYDVRTDRLMNRLWTRIRTGQ
jgi:putrescine transport system substrate-binding protein